MSLVERAIQKLDRSTGGADKSSTGGRFGEKLSRKHVDTNDINSTDDEWVVRNSPERRTTVEALNPLGDSRVHSDANGEDKSSIGESSVGYGSHQVDNQKEHREGLARIRTDGDTTEHVEKSTYEPIKIPLRKLRAARMITPNAPRSMIAEEFRAVKRPILAHCERKDRRSGDKSNVIMVTSCVSGEGKTYSAINLAMSIAMERDKSVLLIDGDIMKASAGSILGLSNKSYGLMDLMIDDEPDLSRALRSTNVKNLEVMAAGKAHENSTEILASSQMAQLIDYLSNQDPRRIIVCDAPPVLQTSEASALARQVGQIVFVVGASQTTQGLVLNTVASMDTEARIGFLLNKARSSRTTMMYGYGYGYGYGHRESGNR